MAYCNNKAQEKARYLAVTEVRNSRSVSGCKEIRLFSFYRLPVD